MKKTIIAGLLVLVTASSYAADTYNFGAQDVIMGIYNINPTRTTGYGTDFVIDLGSVANLQTLNIGGNNALSSKINETFGTLAWWNDTSLKVGVIQFRSDFSTYATAVGSFTRGNFPGGDVSGVDNLNQVNSVATVGAAGGATKYSIIGNDGNTYSYSTYSANTFGALAFENADANQFGVFSGPISQTPNGTIVLNAFDGVAFGNDSGTGVTNGIATIDLQNMGNANVVPEPATYALFGFSALLLTILVRRKSNA